MLAAFCHVPFHTIQYSLFALLTIMIEHLQLHNAAHYFAQSMPEKEMAHQTQLGNKITWHWQARNVHNCNPSAPWVLHARLQATDVLTMHFVLDAPVAAHAVTDFWHYIPKGLRPHDHAERLFTNFSWCKKTQRTCAEVSATSLQGWASKWQLCLHTSSRLGFTLQDAGWPSAGLLGLPSISALIVSWITCWHLCLHQATRCGMGTAVSGPNQRDGPCLLLGNKCEKVMHAVGRQHAQQHWQQKTFVIAPDLFCRTSASFHSAVLFASLYSTSSITLVSTLYCEKLY